MNIKIIDVLINIIPHPGLEENIGKYCISEDIELKGYVYDVSLGRLVMILYGNNNRKIDMVVNNIYNIIKGC